MNKIQESHHNIVFIATRDKIHGTAFIVKNNHKQMIISNTHVYNQINVEERNSILCGIISPSSRNSKKIQKFEFYEINFLEQNQDPRADICCFEFKKQYDLIESYGFSTDTICTSLELDEIELLSRIHFSGYPLANDFLKMGSGITLICNEAIISSKKYTNSDEKLEAIFIDRLINPGSSGSPVFFNDKIIGITSATLNSSQKVGDSIINVPVNIGIVRASSYILELVDIIK